MGPAGTAATAACYSGIGLTGNCTAADPIRLDTVTAVARLSTTATLTFSSLTAATATACNEQTMTLTGAVIGDEIMLGPPAPLEPGLLPSARVIAADTVAVRLCNVTIGVIRPAALSWRATINRGL